MAGAKRETERERELRFGRLVDGKMANRRKSRKWVRKK